MSNINNSQKTFSTVETEIGAGARILSNININTPPPTEADKRQEMKDELTQNSNMEPRTSEIEIRNLENLSHRELRRELGKFIALQKKNPSDEYFTTIKTIRKILNARAKEKRRNRHLITSNENKGTEQQSRKLSRRQRKKNLKKQ